MLDLQQFVGALLDDAEVEDDVVVGDAGGRAQQLLDLRLAAADLVEHLLDAALQIRQDGRRVVELGRRRVCFLLRRLDLVLEGHGMRGEGDSRGERDTCNMQPVVDKGSNEF